MVYILYIYIYIYIYQFESHLATFNSVLDKKKNSFQDTFLYISTQNYRTPPKNLCCFKVKKKILFDKIVKNVVFNSLHSFI